MAAYLFHLELAPFNSEMQNTIPAHRAHIDKLFASGKLFSYSVSAMRNQIWCVLPAESEQEAMEVVLAFPLFPYFTDVACHPLLFHNVLPATMPLISLN